MSALPKSTRGPTAYLLESVAGGENWARYSFWEAALQPCFMKKGRFDSDPREETPQDSEPGQPAGTCARVDGGISAGNGARPALVLVGGAVGHLSYDVVRTFEELPSSVEIVLGCRWPFC